MSQIASLLRDIDLDRVSSYIVIHSVSAYDADTEISYYEWLIENLTRQRNVERTRLASLTDSIDSYEKDSLVIFSGQENSTASDSEDINHNYDAMITEKLASQARIAAYTRSISYYQSVIEGFQTSGGASGSEEIEQVRQYLEDLNGAIGQLIQNITLTVNDYYQTAAFSNQARTLVPATSESVSLISGTTVKIVLATQGILFLLYFAAACVLGIRESNPVRNEPNRKQKASV